MGFVMEPIYWGISWILLAWHSLWDAIGLKGTWLSTNWDWILAIVFLVITVRIVIFPLFVKQIRSQRAMQALAPRVKELQEKHKGDKETLQKEIMELYRTEKANPLMGCLPLLLQMPIFFGVFHIVKRLDGNASRDTDAYGWKPTQYFDASMADLFGVGISARFEQGGNAAILCGILGVIMIVTTYLTSRQMILKTGWSEEPTQRMMQKLMLYGIPATLVISAVAFPLGLIIYWTTTNLFSLGQQMWVLRKYPPPKLGKDATPKPQLDPEAAKALAPKVGAKPERPKAVKKAPVRSPVNTPSKSASKAADGAPDKAANANKAKKAAKPAKKNV